MNAIKIYIGIVYEDEKKIGYSYQVQSLLGDILSSQNRVVKEQGLENFTASIIKQVLFKTNEGEPLYIAIYTDYPDVADYISKLIHNQNYEHIRRLKYQPRGRLFRTLKDYNVKLLLSTISQNEVLALMKVQAEDALDDFVAKQESL